MNMTCKVVMDLVELYHEGIVSQESAEEIRAHLKNCEKCRSYYRQFDRVRRQKLLAQPEPEYTLDAGVSSRCYAELSRRMRRHHYMRIIGASAAIGAGTIMLLIGILLTCRKQTDSSIC